MSAATLESATPSPAQRVACWLLAALLLLQAIWLPFHLATERHLAPGHDASWAVGAATAAETTATDTTAIHVVAKTADEPDAPPHSVLDHQDQKHLRHDEHDDDRQPAVAGDDDGQRGDEAPPLLWLADAALQLPIGRAPPQFAAVDLRPQIRSPLLAAAQPRAPPHG